jgi:hypothetical protein
VLAVHHQVTLLVVHGDLAHDNACGAVGLEPGDLHHRKQRIADIDRLEEARGLLDEADQRIAQHVREDAAAGGRLDHHLQAMRQHVAMAARLAVDAVVVDGMIVAAGELESREQRLGLGARIDVEALPEREVFEIVRRPEAVLRRVEPLRDPIRLRHAVPRLGCATKIAADATGGTPCAPCKSSSSASLSSSTATTIPSRLAPRFS